MESLAMPIFSARQIGLQLSKIQVQPS